MSPVHLLVRRDQTRDSTRSKHTKKNKQMWYLHLPVKDLRGFEPISWTSSVAQFLKLKEKRGKVPLGRTTTLKKLSSYKNKEGGGEYHYNDEPFDLKERSTARCNTTRCFKLHCTTL